MKVAGQRKRNLRGPRDTALGSGPKSSKRSVPRADLRVESNGGVTIFGDGNNGKYLDGEIPESDRHYATSSTYTDVIVYHVGNIDQTHLCPICNEPCDCEEFMIWAECSHCPSDGKEGNLVLSSKLED